MRMRCTKSTESEIGGNWKKTKTVGIEETLIGGDVNSHFMDLSVGNSCSNSREEQPNSNSSTSC